MSEAPPVEGGDGSQGSFAVLFDDRPLLARSVTGPNRRHPTTTSRAGVDRASTTTLKKNYFS